MKNFVVSIVFALALAGAARAQVPDVYVEYETVISQQGETEQDFVLRVAPLLRDRTMDTGWEICGVLAEGGGKLGVILVSSQSTLTCVLRDSMVPEGMTSTGRSIHSHPGPNSKDVGFTSMDHALAEHSGHRLTAVQGNSRKDRRGGGFSTQDFQAGPGYLVLEREVLFQEGFRTVRRIGRI